MKKKITVPKIIKSSVELSGTAEALVTGCLGLVFYAQNEVRIKTPEGELSVLGEKLIMRWAGAGKLLVSGNISSVSRL